MNLHGWPHKAAMGLLAAGLLLTCASLALAQGDPLGPAQRKWVKEHEPVKVGGFKQRPPYGFVDQHGRVRGLTIDFWKLLSQKVYVPVSFECAHPDELTEGMNSGRFDSLAGVMNPPAQDPNYNYTKPYYTIMSRVWLGPGLKQAEGWGALKGVPVGTVKGDLGQKAAQKHGLSAKVYPNYVAALEALTRGEVKALVAEELPTAYHLGRAGLGRKVRRSEVAVESGRLALPVAKNNAMLLEILNQGVEAISPEEEDRLAAKWLSD